jgi:hypothetical protein
MAETYIAVIITQYLQIYPSQLILLATGCGLRPVTVYKAQHALLLQAECCMVPLCWPAALGEFGAFGSELGIV